MGKLLTKENGMAEGKKSEFKRIMGMYKCIGAQGPYIAGKAITSFTIREGSRLYLFKNEQKQSDKHPDYNLCIKGALDE